jgi:adenylylsulfate kinase-like enzyme
MFILLNMSQPLNSPTICWLDSDRRHDKYIIACEWGVVVWSFGAGKSTIAHDGKKPSLRIRSYVLDATMSDRNKFRSGIHREDRRKYQENSISTLVTAVNCFSFIYLRLRQRICQKCLSGDNFYEIYIKCSIQECQKGIQRHDKAKIIKHYTGYQLI